LDPNHQILPEGYFWYENKRCRRLVDIDCTFDGFQMTVPSTLMASLSSADYQANPSAFEPFSWDRKVTQNSGQHSMLGSADYPARWEWYMDNITMPIGRSAESFYFIDASVPNPARALFPAKDVEDRNFHRSKSCDRTTEIWGGCQRRVVTGALDLDRMGWQVSTYGNLTNNLFTAPAEHPWNERGGVKLASYEGSSIDAKRWSGFDLPGPSKEMKVLDMFVEELTLPLKAQYTGTVYMPFAPARDPLLEFKADDLVTYMADVPGVEFAMVALDVYCFTKVGVVA
jgi:hypothetical protein